METLKVNDIVVLKPEEVSNVKPYARPWFEGPYVVIVAGSYCDRQAVQVSSLHNGKLLGFDTGTDWLFSTRFTVLSDKDIFGAVDRCAVTRIHDSTRVARVYLLEREGTQEWFCTEEGIAFYRQAASDCGFPYGDVGKAITKTRVDNARIIFRARELYTQEVQAHGVPTIPRPVQARPSTSASQSNCTVARCLAQASVLADSRLMCDMHAKEFAFWEKEQNRQVEQAKVELDRPFQRLFGSSDVCSNPWNR